MRILHLILILFIAGCVENESNLENSTDQKVTRINVDISKTDTLKMSRFFESIDYKYLETSPSQPIGRISKIQVQNNQMLLLDLSKNSIWLFTTSGKFLKQIEIMKGRGPGEVEHLLDAYMDVSNDIHVLGFYKVLVFDSDGNFKKQIPLDFKVNKISYDHKDNLYYGYVGVSINTRINQSHRNKTLYVFNDNGEIVESALPIGEGKEGILYEAPNNFPEFTKKKYFFLSLVDTVYEIETQNSLTSSPRYYLDYGDYSIPSEVFEKRENYSKEFWNWKEFWDKEIVSQNYLTYLTNFEITDSYIHFRVGNDTDSYMIIYNKNERKTYVGKDKFLNDLDYGPSPYIYLSSDDALYTYVEANDFINHIDDLPESHLKYFLSDEIKMIYQSVGKYSNPILMKLSYK